MYKRQPARSTINETEAAIFKCSVIGNPKPTVVWSKLHSQTNISQSLVSGETLRLQNSKGSDAGVYKCSAVNILGQAHAVGHLIVNGELLFFFAFSYCKDLLCAPYKMKDEERYYLATLQKNVGAISRCSQQYLAETIFHSTNKKSSELIFFCRPSKYKHRRSIGGFF